MTKGKKWTIQEETQLKTLYESNLPLSEIAVQMKKSVGAIELKCRRMGLVAPRANVDLRAALPRELPSVEEDLRMLAGALRTAIKPGLDRVEVQRLQTVANLAKTYKEVVADYIDYRGIERELVEMEELYTNLLAQRNKNPPNAQPENESAA